MSSLSGNDRFQLEDGDVVAFLGGTNMVRGVRCGELETTLTKTFVNLETEVRFRDLSWEADTVYRLGTVKERWRPDGFGNQLEQFRRIGMTVAILQFGKMESMDGLASLPRFEEHYRSLLKVITQQARQVVLVTPIRFEKPENHRLPDLSKHNLTLQAYVKITKKLSDEFNTSFVNLFSPEFKRLTSNGIHILPSQQSTVASEIAAQLGVESAGGQLDVTLLQAVREKQRLWYDYWRPANWKLLYGDDSQREFTRGGENYIPFREEWKKLLPLVAIAEQRIFAVARAEADPGYNRPAPEKLHGDSHADIQAEIESFEVPEGFEVNLFASQEHGLTSPLNLRWDPAGRMYVTVTTTYPHVFPGDVPNDKVIVLQDTDQDGQADKSTVFAEGLNIPTGIEWGEGGIYVGQNTEVLFLRDVDGDLRADIREVMLGGFGNGDSHQTINSFVWSPDGELYFGQGDGCESRVETPWGNSELYQAGFYRLRPRRQQLDPLLDDFMGPGNPWGVGFDRWGQILCVDGAGGVSFLSPGQIPVHHRRRLGRIGDPGGYCGIGLLEGRHLPSEYQGHFVVGDFKQNRIKRFSLEDRQSGFSLNWETPLLTSSHRNFRPVDVKVGPDGAVYVVDWYNPITCHQDDAYRHPDRDKAHGRIWRISTTRKTTQPSNLLQAPLREVVESLAAPEYVTRYLAKRALTVRDEAQVAKEIKNWVASLDSAYVDYDHNLFEAISALATLEIVDSRLLEKLLVSPNPNARAFASRMVGRWHDRLESPLEMLSQKVIDSHPRVRLEAVIACASIPRAESVAVAAKTVHAEMDSWIDYAFRQAVQHLAAVWRPAFERGDLKFENAVELAVVLAESGGGELIDSLKRSFKSTDLKEQPRLEVLMNILTAGNSHDISEFALREETFEINGVYHPELHGKALRIVADNASYRDVRPAGDWQTSLLGFFDSQYITIQTGAILLAGAWDVDACKPRIYAAAQNSQATDEIRVAGFQSLALLEQNQGRDGLIELLDTEMSLGLQLELLKALAVVDSERAIQAGVGLLLESELSNDGRQQLLVSLLQRRDATKQLSAELQKVDVDHQQIQQLLSVILATGRADQQLLTVIASKLGVSAKPPSYSESLIKSLKQQAIRTGDAERGANVFKAVACASCHRIKGQGGTIGPDLTGLGTTLSGERIIEELIWPNRQVKEGFSSLRVITQDGKVLQGYQRKTKQSEARGGIALLDPQSQQLILLQADDIDEVQKSSSVMPEGLTNLLS
ncbi:MAG: hypothetical protein CMJ76_13250, partial [Planctomycetaceae bacterium]|nr:hypothetical protein [Planctomycetaceae bacterium]